MKYAGIFLLSAIMWAGVACGQSANTQSSTGNVATDSTISDSLIEDSLRVEKFPVDSLPAADRDSSSRYSKLTDEDFRIIAEELGVEIAAIKAVVACEAGTEMKGFFAPGVPVINFDRKMYNLYAARTKSKAAPANESVPAGLTGYAKQEWTLLMNARKKNADAALMGTFWGMFQIGGFNYKICGFETVDEFVKVMSESEFSQLEIFAKFITATGMLNDLKNKNWAGFARKFNGPSYARRGYHTKMANAYRKFSKVN